MEERNYKVYILEFPNEKLYIGLTGDSLYKRWKNGNGYRGQSYLWNAIEKYGWSNIIKDVYAIDLTEQEAKQMEIDLIAEYNTTDRRYGYNISTGGESASGFKHSEETKKMFSETRKGEGNSFYGKHHTDKTKSMISKANKGKYVGSKSVLSRRVQKIDVTTHDVLEYFDSITEAADNETMRKHISDCCLGKRISCNGFGWQYVDEPHEFVSNWSSLKSVCQLDKFTGDIIDVFNTMREAVEKTGVAQDSIKKCCDGKRKSAGGFGWMYFDEYERGVA